MFDRDPVADATHHYRKAETRLAYPGERVFTDCGATREAPSSEAVKLSAPCFSSVELGG